MVTRDNIRRWLEHGKKLNATHMIVISDTWSYEYMPSYVLEGEDVRERCNEINSTPYESVKELYNYGLDLDMQLNSPMAFHTYPLDGRKEETPFSIAYPEYTRTGERRI